MSRVSGRGAYEAPKDYAEVWVEFYEPTKRWVRSKGVPDEYVEDVAQDVMAKFMEKDGLSFYDPHKEFDTGQYTQHIPGKRMRRATFTGYMRSFVLVYCMNYRDKITKTIRREGTYRLDAPLDSDSTVTWLDSLVSDGDMEATTVAGADCAVILSLGVAQMHRYDEQRRAAEAEAARLRKRTWTLEQSFYTVALSLREFGVIDRVWIGTQMRLTPSQVSMVLTEMREVLRSVGAMSAIG